MNIAAAVRLRRKHEPRKHHGSASRAICFFVVLLASLNVASAQSSEVLSLDAYIPLSRLAKSLGRQTTSSTIRSGTECMCSPARATSEVFEQRDADHYDRIARYPAPSGSQTGLFVTEWGELFVAVRAQSGQSAEVRIYQAH